MEKILSRLDEIEQLLLQQKMVFTVAEAAKYLGVAEGTVYKMTSAGTIQFSKPNGKLIYFSKDALTEWMLSNSNKAKHQKETEAATYIATHRTKQ